MLWFGYEWGKWNAGSARFAILDVGWEVRPKVNASQLSCHVRATAGVQLTTDPPRRDD